MIKLTTNENILFQVAFKEACMFARNDTIKAETSDKQLLSDSLSLYNNVLIAGLTKIQEDKNAAFNGTANLEEIKIAVAHCKTQTDFVNYQRNNIDILNKLGKEDKESLKLFINAQFSVKDSEPNKKEKND